MIGLWGEREIQYMWPSIELLSCIFVFSTSIFRQSREILLQFIAHLKKKKKPLCNQITVIQFWSIHADIVIMQVMFIAAESSLLVLLHLLSGRCSVEGLQRCL